MPVTWESCIWDQSRWRRPTSRWVTLRATSRRDIRASGGRVARDKKEKARAVVTHKREPQRTRSVAARLPAREPSRRAVLRDLKNGSRTAPKNIRRKISYAFSDRRQVKSAYGFSFIGMQTGPRGGAPARRVA